MLEAVRCADDGFGVVKPTVVPEEVLSAFAKSVLLKEHLTAEPIRLSNRGKDCVGIGDVGQAHFKLPNSRRSPWPRRHGS